jgi:hypothetical protein
VISRDEKLDHREVLVSELAAKSRPVAQKMNSENRSKDKKSDLAQAEPKKRSESQSVRRSGVQPVRVSSYENSR